MLLKHSQLAVLWTISQLTCSVPRWTTRAATKLRHGGLEKQDLLQPYSQGVLAQAIIVLLTSILTNESEETTSTCGVQDGRRPLDPQCSQATGFLIVSLVIYGDVMLIKRALI